MMSAAPYWVPPQQKIKYTFSSGFSDEWIHIEDKIFHPLPSEEEQQTTITRTTTNNQTSPSSILFFSRNIIKTMLQTTRRHCLNLSQNKSVSYSVIKKKKTTKQAAAKQIKKLTHSKTSSVLKKTLNQQHPERIKYPNQSWQILPHLATVKTFPLIRISTDVFFFSI